MCVCVIVNVFAFVFDGMCCNAGGQAATSPDGSRWIVRRKHGLPHRREQDGQGPVGLISREELRRRGPHVCIQACAHVM